MTTTILAAKSEAKSEQEDVLLRAKMALVECINAVEKWGSDGGNGGEADPWNIDTSLSDRLHALATDVAAVEQIKRAQKRGVRSMAKSQTEPFAHPTREDSGGGAAGAAAVSFDEGELGGITKWNTIGSGSRNGGTGESTTFMAEQPAKLEGTPPFDNKDGSGGDQMNAALKPESATATLDGGSAGGERYQAAPPKSAMTAAAAAPAAQAPPPAAKEKKMEIKRQTRDAQPTGLNETCFQQWKRYALTTFGLQTIFSVLLLAIGLAYLTQRLKWTWQYSLYWCMMTALTVGYGDSPQCSTDADPPVGYSGSGFNETWVEPPVCYGTGDRWEDMLFTLIFAFFSVTIIDSIIIEVLDRIERKERKLFAKVQRKLLELYSKAHKHAEKMDEIERLASDDPAEQERLMEEALLVLDDEEQAASDEWWGRNCFTRFAAWLYRMSNHYANTRDAIIWLVFVFIGVGFYMGHYADSTSQDVTFVSALYWVIITGLAVGYGDYHPDDNVGYMFTFFYSFIFFLLTFRIISQFIKAVRRPSSYKQVLQSTFDIDRMKSFDRDDDGVVTREEYLAAVLVMLGQTDLETCDLILKYYDILDHDGDHVLTYEDIRIANERGVANMNHFEAASKAQKAESKRKSTVRRFAGSNGTKRSQSAPPPLAGVSSPATPLRSSASAASFSKPLSASVSEEDAFQGFLDKMELKSSPSSTSTRRSNTMRLAEAESSTSFSEIKSPGRARARHTTTSSV